MDDRSRAEADGLCFEPSQEVRMTREGLDGFIEKEIEPLEDEYAHLLGEDAERNRVDDDHHWTDDFREVREKVRTRASESGYFTMHMSREVGGGGLGPLAFTQVVEHLYDRDPDGFHPLIIDISLPLLEGAAEDPYQKENVLDLVMDAEKKVAFGLTEPDHGNDITWMDSKAEKEGDEWVIDGTKAFVSGSPYADFVIVLARTSGEDGDAKGITAFIVESDNPGWEVGKMQRPMGSMVGKQAINHFTDCRVPERNVLGEVGTGLTDMGMTWVGTSRIRIAAEAVGRASWMLDRCLEYATNRETFGKPIGKRQFVQGMLADARADIEQVRWLYRYAAWKLERGEADRWLQSAAKLRGAELWNDVADVAVQIHGGAGYMRSLPFEREYRDARAARIYEGTDEIQRRTIARDLLDF